MKGELQVNLAERNIVSSYFPANTIFEGEEILDLLHALVFSLLLKRKIVSTRFGSDEKKTQYNDVADDGRIKDEIRGYCRSPLETYLSTLEVEFEPKDILEIYTKMFLI